MLETSYLKFSCIWNVSASIQCLYPLISWAFPFHNYHSASYLFLLLPRPSLSSIHYWMITAQRCIWCAHGSSVWPISWLQPHFQLVSDSLNMPRMSLMLVLGQARLLTIAIPTQPSKLKSYLLCENFPITPNELLFKSTLSIQTHLQFSPLPHSTSCYVKSS